MDPGHELQNQIIFRLRNYAPLQEFVSQRVYDSPPRNAQSGDVTADMPYISMGSRQVISDDAECIEGYEAFVQVDVWAHGPGRDEVSQVAQQVRQALREYELPLTDNALVLLEHDNTQYLKEPDGITNHAAISFRALLES